MLITTSFRPSRELVSRARRIGEETGGRWLARGRKTLPMLMAETGERKILVLTEERLIYYPDGEHPLFFHPSMAQVRVKRLLNGEPDKLLETADVRAGDTVIDCTAGLASDAILFSFAAGGSGTVIALESEPVMALLLREGLSRYLSGIEELDEAMRRIEVIQTDHAEYLGERADNSADIVYFDPMFRLPVAASSSMTPLREIANSNPLSPESVADALRVARRKVVLKEHRSSPEFARLGFARPERYSNKFAYGVIEP